jgi:pumilio family protein 6
MRLNWCCSLPSMSLSKANTLVSSLSSNTPCSDTKLVSKTLVSEMTGPATKLYVSPQGRRSLFYLLVPRTRRHFTPAQIASLAETDEIRARTSKKTVEVREGEVRKAASEALLAWVEENGADIIREPGGSLVVTEIMLFADGGMSSAVLTLFLLTPFFVRQNGCFSNSSTRHIISLPLRGCRCPPSHRPPSYIKALQNTSSRRTL